MPTLTRGLLFVLLGVTACGGGNSAGNTPPPEQSAGGEGGSGGPSGPGGSGGTPGKKDAGAAGQSGTGGARADASGGPAGAGGGVTPEPDAAAPVDTGGPSQDTGSNPMPPPLPAEEKPLPPCKATKMVAGDGALGGAISGAQPGDCLVLADGTYSFPSISAKGTEAAPIVIRAQNRLKVVIASGNLTLSGAAYVVVEGVMFTSSGNISINNSQYCRITRIRFNPTNQTGNDWVNITGTSHHNRVDHSEFGPKTVLGNTIMFGGAGPQIVQHNRVDHNYFHDIKGGGGNGWETLRIGLSSWGQSKAFNIVEFNLFRAATGDPETISVKSSDNIIRYNTYRATNGEITLRHGNRTLVYGNFMLGDGLAGARGMRVLGADHRIFNNYIESISATAGIYLRGGTNNATDGDGTDFYRVFRTHIVNNTLVGGSGIRIGGTDMPPVDSVVANNLVQNTTGPAISDMGQGTKIEGNLVNPMGGDATAGAMVGTKVVNPMLVKMDGAFRLMAGSPALDAAVGSYPYVMDDMDGHARNQPDVGADELATGVITRRALTEADVGPNAP